MNVAADFNLPVWLYWEGDLPEWIAECRKTIFAHAPQVHLLSYQDFNDLREFDRDINIENLYVAHRADFIRAYLLAKFGGLWIDSDCVVLKPLKPIMELLNEYEFLGYRERSGEVTNNFMGASKESKIAAAYYNEVCRILRAGEKIEWLTLGSKALTAVLENSHRPWYELQVDEIQPICWSNPGAFFKERDDLGHELAVNPKSYCYMLSANMLRGYMSDHQNPALQSPDTFFSYLLKLSKEQEQCKI
jgi:mannosyltransferase OCH1-like enzyme